MYVFYKNQQKYITTLLLIAFFITGYGTQLLANENIYTKIAEYYTHPQNLSNTAKQSLQVVPLSIAEQNRTLFRVLSEHGNPEYNNFSNIFDHSLWGEMEFLSGPRNDSSKSLFASWDNHTTQIGKIVGKRIAVQQTADIQVLRSRQAIIRTFLDQENEALVNCIEDNLQTIRNNEPVFLKIFTSQSIENQRRVKMLFPFWEKYIQTPIIALDLLDKYNDFYTFSTILKLIPSLAEVYLNGTDTKIQHAFNLLFLFSAPINYLISKRIKTSVKQANPFRENRKLMRSFYTANVAFAIFLAIMSYKEFEVKETQRSILQEQMIAVASVVKSMQKINAVIQKDDTLKNNFPSLIAIDNLHTSSKKLEKFINLLHANTFTGKPSYFSRTGNILRAYKLVGTFKNDLVESFEAIGEVDAYLSMAKTIKKHQDSEPFCFAEFIENAETPQLELNAFWFPQLLHNKRVKAGEHAIISNSIQMGHENNRNIILTGPNTGGKSTLLKGIITSLLLAQTFGVAPARSMKFTPFAKIQTYINLPDNAAEGISLFKAELLRVKSLINTMKQLKPGEFSFSILDEVFSGTNPIEAVAGSKMVITAMTKLPQSMNIIATHFGDLTTMEQELNGAFVNYKVDVNIREDGTLQFPYTWHPGISDKNIATILLQQEDFLNDF